VKSSFRTVRFFCYFCLTFFLLSLNSYALAKGPEETGKETLTLTLKVEVEAEKALQAKVDGLKSAYEDAVSLYNRGRYQQARNMFLRIAADAARNDLDPSNDLDLGYRVEWGLRKFLNRSEQKIAQATEEAKRAEEKARKRAEVEAKEREEKEARRKAAAELAYKEKVKGILTEDFQTAERLYKQKRFLEAKPILEKVAGQKEATGVSLGWLADRRLKSYLSDIDGRIEAEGEQRARKRAEERRLAQQEEKRKAEAAEVKAGQEKFARLKARYEEAIALYKEGKYQQAKEIFISVQRGKGDLDLGREIEEGLKNYLAGIDEDIKARSPRQQVAKLERRVQVDQQRSKVLAKHYYQDAKDNYDRRAFNRAYGDVKRALEFDPEHKEAGALLARIETVLGPAGAQNEAGVSVAQKVVEQEKVARQRYEKVLSAELKRPRH